MLSANGVIASTTTGGTGNLTLAAVSSFPAPGAALATGASNPWRYAIQRASDKVLVETGVGYLSDSTTLVRSVIEQTWDGSTYATGGSASNLSAGTAYYVYPVFSAGDVAGMPQLYKWTDTTDITPSATPTATLVGSSRSIYMPSSGVIELYLAARLTAVNGNINIGLRIGGTDYWSKGTHSGNLYYSEVLNAVVGGITDTGYGGGMRNGTSASWNGRAWLSIDGYGMPSGIQTVQPIVGYASAAPTIKGTITPTRIYAHIIPAQ